jgi:hypothetical protein
MIENIPSSKACYYETVMFSLRENNIQLRLPVV